MNGHHSSTAPKPADLAAANRSSLQMLVRSEVDGAMSRLGLVPVQQMEEAQAQVEELRHEVDRLRSASTTSSAKATAPKAAAPKAAGRKAAGRKAAASKPAVKPAAAPRTLAKKAPKATAGRVATKPAAATTQEPSGNPGEPATIARPSAVTTRVKPDGT